MKWFISWLVFIAFTGCTTTRRIDGSPTELQQFINSGGLLKPGDHVRIVTADEKAHRIAITKVEPGQIVGPNESVPVDEIVSLEIEKLKPAKPLQIDTKLLTDWLIAIGAYAMKPITVDSTPTL
jgi:hypothetical protein